jgi:LacI family transcriptional regulator
MSATLKDVAREACVSVASVSRVLNGTGVVGEEIRARVAEVAARLNYVPNIGAQSLMTRRTRLIGMLLPRMHGEFFSELIRGADEAARELGMHLLISTSHEDTEETSRALRAMNGRVDGLLAMLPQVNGKFLQETMRSDLPIMLISTADVEHACGSMHVDNYGGAYAMVRHLADCGHRYIAHIRGRRDNIDAEERLRGYRDAMAQVVPGGRELILHGDFTEEFGYQAAQEILALAERPQAIFAANDLMAIGCMSALMEAGVTVPEQIAVVGFDDITTARYVRPALTTVCVKIADLGRRAVTRLADAIVTPSELPPDTETVPAEVVVRKSCGGVRPRS